MGGSARDSGGKGGEQGVGCCSPFVMGTTSHPRPALQPSILGRLEMVPWLREALCVLKGHREQGKGEFVFQA